MANSGTDVVSRSVPVKVSVPPSSTPRAGTAAPKTASLPEKVAQLYYSLGLLCSTYPTIIITLAISVVLICCYPLVNLPLPGNLPLLQVPVSNQNNNTTHTGSEQPWCYVQQIVMRTAIVPWTDDLVLADAFRAPLYEVFKLLEIVRNYQQGARTLGHLCLHVEAVKRAARFDESNILPEYNCLVLSPANFWQQDIQRFNQDAHLLTTIFNHQNIQKGKTSLAEVLFGMNLKETGIKRYPLRNRQRVIQYAITIVFKHYDPQYITGLKHKLETLYSLHQSNRTTNTGLKNDIIYIYYPGVFNYVEFIPLTVAFLILFFYIYFSVRKIEMINSKFGMAFAAVVTVLGSLLMSVGLCFFFGLTLSMQGKEIFPYLVILVGLENVLVLTKSVVSTPQHLDVKIRVAQGLSKEGWSITKNILVEITILTIGLATFVPVIQEFCIFAITGLISDFFLQMFFFSTILAIDIHRMEITAEKTHTNFRNSLYQPHNQQIDERIVTGTSYPLRMSRSKSHPRLTMITSSHHSASEMKKIPKRLRLVNIWARTRFFQRAFMIWMIVWISMIVYNSGVIEHFLDMDRSQTKTDSDTKPVYRKSSSFVPSTTIQPSSLQMNYVTQKVTTSSSSSVSADEMARLRYSANIGTWPRLPTQHWPALFDRYNLSLSGHQIAVLPSIRVACAVNSEQAVLLRNPNEKYDAHAFQWQALAAALDPIDFNEITHGKLDRGTDNLDDRNKGDAGEDTLESQPFYPHSPMEIFLATILCVISVVVLAYTMVVLYRCVCTRNYAEWRASWSSERGGGDEPVAQQLVMEAVPLVLDGHVQEVECLVTDGNSIVSSCLGGQLKIWDAATGEQLSYIDRKLYFCGSSNNNSKSTTIPTLTHDSSLEFDDSMLSDYESGSPPSRDESTISFPSLQKKINTNFTNFKLEPTMMMTTKKESYDFDEHYRQLYINQDDESSVSGIRHRNALNTARWISEQGQQQQRIVTIASSSTIDGNDNNNSQPPPIWCMDYLDNLIVIGCANGRLEFWEGTTGKFKCIFEDGNGIGITSVKIIGSRLIVAKLNGNLDFLQLQSYSQGRQIDWGFTSAYRRTHVRTGSTGSIIDCTPAHSLNEDLRCIRLHTAKAHQQPITALDVEGGRVVSGSQDHTLKVFRLEDGGVLYTLHGHCGPISALFIDRVSPTLAGSGSQDGLLCVWDLGTGACMYSAQAHDGSVTALTYSASYVISLGTDDKICVWERFQGHLLNTINVNHASCTANLLMLTHSLLVTARQGSLVVVDVRTGETARVVSLGHRDGCVFVKQQLLLRDASVVCDYGTQLRIVRFPLITHKYE